MSFTVFTIRMWIVHASVTILRLAVESVCIVELDTCNRLRMTVNMIL